MSLIRTAFSILIVLLPSFLKIPLYRWFYGYQIGKKVKIGFSPFLSVRRCTIGDNARIGHFNLFHRIGELTIGEHASIGFLNLFRGGDSISNGAYAQFLRLNVVNSIPDPDVINPTTPVFEIGTGGFVTTQHWLDFTDRLTIAARSRNLPHCAKDAHDHPGRNRQPDIAGRNPYCFKNSGGRKTTAEEQPKKKSAETKTAFTKENICFANSNDS